MVRLGHKHKRKQLHDVQAQVRYKKIEGGHGGGGGGGCFSYVSQGIETFRDKQIMITMTYDQYVFSNINFPFRRRH